MIKKRQEDFYSEKEGFERREIQAIERKVRNRYCRVGTEGCDRYAIYGHRSGITVTANNYNAGISF